MNAVETRRRLYSRYFNAASRKYGIPDGLLEAIGRRESQFNPDARGAAGELGIMQFMPGTAADYGLKGPGFDWRRDPAKSIDASGRLMRDLGRRYDGDWPKAIAAYNAGPGNVDKGRIPASTRGYVADVLSFFNGLGTGGGSGTPESRSTPNADPSAGGASGSANYEPSECGSIWDPTSWGTLASCATSAATPIVIIVVLGVAVTWFGLQGLASS